MLVLSFSLGFIALLQGAKFLVDGASDIARRFGISELIIGLTLVSIGTSFPELAINIFASFKKESDIILGNIIGSNISNTLLILGVTGLITPLTFPKCKLRKELYYYLAILALFLISIFITSPFVISKSEALLLLIASFLSLFLFFLPNANEPSNTADNSPKLSLSICLFLIGAILLPLGGHLVIQSSMDIALTLGLSKAFVSLFAIALGTSLPELVTSVTAALKGNSAMALGNIVGSNIFNLSLIIGVSGLIHVIPVSWVLGQDALILASSGLILFLIVALSRKSSLSRGFPLAFLLAYLAYIAFIACR